MTAPRTIRPAPVRRSIVVRVEPEKAFSAFTGRMGSWWPKTHSIGGAPQQDVVVEPRPGGRWYERAADGSECEWGQVLAWEPPGRVLLGWQLNGDWHYDPDLITEVEVTFTPLGPRETRVDLEHRNLERFGDKENAVRKSFESKEGWGGMLALFGGFAESN